MDIHILEELGMTAGEAKVYLALLKLGLTTSGKIITESGVSRSKVYDVLDRLIAKGFASEILQNGVRSFEATDPSRIVEFLELQQENLAKKISESKRIVPQLQSLQKELRQKQEARVYTGIEGWKSAYSEILSSPYPEYLAFGIGSEKIQSDQVKRFLRNFHLQRAEKKMSARILMDSSTRKSMKAFSHLELYDVRYSTSTFPTNIAVVGDYVLTLVWSDLPVAYLIRSEQIASKYKTFFEKEWKKAKK